MHWSVSIQRTRLANKEETSIKKRKENKLTPLASATKKKQQQQQIAVKPKAELRNF